MASEAGSFDMMLFSDGIQTESKKKFKVFSCGLVMETTFHLTLQHGLSIWNSNFIYSTLQTAPSAIIPKIIAHCQQ
jgi:hypothetical protein